MPRVNKVIVTHFGALRKKHGSRGLKRIRDSIAALIEADAQRGFVTQLVALDRKSHMKGVGKPVSKAGDRRQTKRAVDDVHDHFQPQYLMLLGAPDVIPHQRLVNPLFQPDVDPDKTVDSDLPYACDAGYGTDANRFLGPTRVIGRLSDIRGVGDTAYLLELLDAAANWTTRSRSSYRNCFGITAEAWKHSTRRSVRKLFGTQKGVKVSPDDGPNWTRAELRDRIHFINCHGDTAKAEFYGENQDDPFDQPVAHRQTHLAGRIRTATVVAAECCFGAELYEPFAGGPIGICQAYLGQGALGFFGSTTIAYGPARGNGLADLLCIEFVRAVLEGASLGRATLTAQQRYIASGGNMGPHDLKTISQFLLLGDPSIHPVKLSAKEKARAEKRARKQRNKGAGSKRGTPDPRGLRRNQLARRGKLIGESTATVAQQPDARLSGDLRCQILERCQDFAPQATMSFELHDSKVPARSVVARKWVSAKTVFHVLMASPQTSGLTSRQPTTRGSVAVKVRSKPAVKTARLVIAREVGGKLDEVVEVYRH